MSCLFGMLLGRLFISFCTFLKQYRSIGRRTICSEIAFLQDEIKRLKTANRVMKQFIRRKKLRPSFLTKCRMMLFAFRFGIPLKKIHLYLPTTQSTIRRYIVKARRNLFSLRARSSRPKSSPAKTAPAIVALVWRIKDANCSWGCLRIALHLWHLKIYLSPSTIRRILLRAKPTPAPSSNKSGDVKSTCAITVNKPNGLWSLDFTTIHILGISPVYVLGVIDHYSRKVFCLSSTFHPTAEWTVRELQIIFAAFGKPKNMLTDNGSVFTSCAFTKLASSLNIRHIRTAVKHPQTNGKIERFFQSLKYEFLCLFFMTGKRRLDCLLFEYLTYYNKFRLHEAIDGQTPDAAYYGQRTSKPDKVSKRIRSPIEEIRMGNGHLKAYRLKQAA